MQAHVADVVFAVLDRGLALREQFEVGDPLEWDREREAVHQLLAAFAPAADEASPDAEEFDFVFSEQGSPEERRALTNATIGFALARWLDECFMDHAAVGSPRREADRFGHAEGIARFWDEARYAETRGDLDALEVMYLCVMLGLRGNWRDKPAQVDAWATRIRAKLERAKTSWTMPASLVLPGRAEGVADDVPLRRMTFSVVLTVALLAPVVLVLLWRM